MAKIYIIEGTKEVLKEIREHESKQLKIRCLVQWYSQEGQDVGHGHKPREGNIWGKIYIEFRDWKKKLVDRWIKCIGKQGDHVEKWYFSF